MSVYCCSDLHANYDIWRQIKNYLKPDDMLYNLGDTIDRGNVGLEILKENFDMPNVTLLKGNHEDFIDKIGMNLYYTKNLQLWYMNGGFRTIEAFNELSEHEQFTLISKVKKLPTHIEYTNTRGEILYLCHAGRQPDTAEIPDMGEGDIPMNNYIWDRWHIHDPYWRGKDNEYCIHGHTPICYIKDYNPPETPQNVLKIFKYCGGHKINMDLGTFNTYTACLLNLDTWEEIYFRDSTLTEEEWYEIEHGNEDIM